MTATFSPERDGSASTAYKPRYDKHHPGKLRKQVLEQARPKNVLVLLTCPQVLPKCFAFHLRWMPCTPRLWKQPVPAWQSEIPTSSNWSSTTVPAAVIPRFRIYVALLVRALT